ncbi:MAG: MoaD/ThiS family protein [Cyclobacteriaceae bacterium]
MKCTVKAFGISRDIIGTRELVMEFPEGQTVGALKARLLELYPRLGNLNSLFVALNSEYAEANQPLCEGDEVALIPPVSGG